MTDPSTGLVAVDAGGTSTRAIVLRPDGECLGYAVAGGGNPISVGAETAAGSAVKSVTSALSKASMPADRVRLVVLAMAGAGTPAVAEQVRNRLVAGGLGAAAVFESDLLATYFSGTHRPDGYAVICGTGAGAIRVEGGHQVAVADALGWLLGDDGSGFWIGHRVVRAVLADLDGRGPATALTPLLLARLGIPAPSAPRNREPILALVRSLYAAPPVRLADHARLVFEAAGDETAACILDDAAVALERTLEAVRSPTNSGPVVLGGGVLGHAPQLSNRLAVACGSAEVRSVPDGALGVCVLALRRSGSHVDARTFQRLSASLAAVR